VHVVAAGETLWQIARDRLGPGASAGAVAREMARIWDLNADSIGSGDPDLIRAGERLVVA
jgi:nucleoid-associated protein YgaU